MSGLIQKLRISDGVLTSILISDLEIIEWGSVFLGNRGIDDHHQSSRMVPESTIGDRPLGW